MKKKSIHHRDAEYAEREREREEFCKPFPHLGALRASAVKFRVFL
jgi:hypothetical protein